MVVEEIDDDDGEVVKRVVQCFVMDQLMRFIHKHKNISVFFVTVTGTAVGMYFSLSR